jgi:outer membrane cobalamin receptor
MQQHNFSNVEHDIDRKEDKRLKINLLYIVFLFSMPLYGQMSFEADTIKINEVVVGRNIINGESAGYNKTLIDSSIMVNYSNRAIADILSENTGIFIKSYGMGGTATPSFRGTDASHTLVDWNGININSPMLGQTDLSLIPVGIMDDIQIYFGGASMLLNNGGIGGTINIETKPEWKKETLVSLNGATGSFGNYSGLMKVKTGNFKFQTVTKAYFQNCENNFRYLNSVIGSEPVWQTRTNSQVRQQGLLQEFYLNNSNNIVSARIWYESSDRNLPASLLTEPNTGEKQFDESLRTMLNYDVFRGNSDFTFTGAWVMSRLNYFNRLASIDSRNLSDELTLKANFGNRIGEYSKLKILIEDLSTVINSNNYNNNKTRNTTTLTASVERNKNRVGTSILIREILDRNNLLIPDFSAGVQFRLIDYKAYYLKANFSRNSKIPTMNEMFWNPGGNPDLKNEYALMYELSYEMNQQLSGPLKLKYDISFFRYNIKDMIQWHPGAYTYWTADNIASVTSTGAESSVSLNYIQNNISTSLRAGYSYTRAISTGSDIENDMSAGKQLQYIPENKANAMLRVAYKNVYSSWIANLTGKRYVTVDNSNYLPGYFVNNLNAGIKFVRKGTSIDVNFGIDNIFNIYYQSIAYYPLPGRSYSLKVLVQIVKL